MTETRQIVLNSIPSFKFPFYVISQATHPDASRQLLDFPFVPHSIKPSLISYFIPFQFSSAIFLPCLPLSPRISPPGTKLFHLAFPVSPSDQPGTWLPPHNPQGPLSQLLPCSQPSLHCMGQGSPSEPAAGHALESDCGISQDIISTVLQQCHVHSCPCRPAHAIRCSECPSALLLFPHKSHLRIQSKHSCLAPALPTHGLSSLLSGLPEGSALALKRVPSDDQLNCTVTNKSYFLLL